MMQFLTRDEWGADYDVTDRALMTGLPVAQVFIHHTVTVPSADPAADMRGIEAIDIARFGVPSYSYVIHPSGTVLEGMGLHRGAHTINNAGQSYNDVAFGVSFIGNFQNDEPTAAARQACAELLGLLVLGGHLQPGYVISGHRDVFATACCGDNLYPIIQTLRDSAGGNDVGHLGDDDLGNAQAGQLANVAAIAAENRWTTATLLRVEQTINAIAAKQGAPVAVDNTAIAKAVVAALNPQQIVDAIIAGVAAGEAKQVADELAKRLAS